MPAGQIPKFTTAGEIEVSMNIPLAVVTLFILFVVGRMLITGSAMAGAGGFNRADEPMIYWSIVFAGVVIVIVLLVFLF